MRLFLLIFILSWLAGCVLGSLQLDTKNIILFVAITAILTWLAKLKRPYVATSALLLALGYFYALPNGEPGNIQCRINEEESITGQVISRPEPKNNKKNFTFQKGQCQILVSAPYFTDVKYHDTVTVSAGSLQTINEVKDYSEGYAAYLQRKGITHTWYYPHVKKELNSTLASNFPYISTQKIHDTMSSKITKLFTRPDSSIIRAMLLGEKGMIPDYITRQFRVVGVSHILAISGLHVTIISGIIYGLISLLPLKPWLRTGIVMTILWLYVIFLGFPVSALRAASFISIALVFLRLGKLTSLPTALIVTAAALITIRPQIIFDVGFQLSVSAVTGIFLALFIGNRRPIWARNKKTLHLTYQMVLVSLGATLGTWPLVAYHFELVSLIGLPANLLVVPVIPSVIFLSILAIAISFIWMPAALSISLLAHFLIKWLLYITGVLSSLPLAFCENINLSNKHAISYYLFTAAVIILILRLQKRNWREIWT